MGQREYATIIVKVGLSVRTVGSCLIQGMLSFRSPLPVKNIIFQKEHEQGDYQNLVFCVMQEDGIGVQQAIDKVVEMLQARIADYQALKVERTCFPADDDELVTKYLGALENFVQGMVVWHMLAIASKSPRSSLVADTKYI